MALREGRPEPAADGGQRFQTKGQSKEPSKHLALLRLMAWREVTDCPVQVSGGSQHPPFGALISPELCSFPSHKSAHHGCCLPGAMLGMVGRARKV